MSIIIYLQYKTEKSSSSSSRRKGPEESSSSRKEGNGSGPNHRKVIANSTERKSIETIEEPFGIPIVIPSVVVDTSVVDTSESNSIIPDLYASYDTPVSPVDFDPGNTSVEYTR